MSVTKYSPSRTLMYRKDCTSADNQLDSFLMKCVYLVNCVQTEVYDIKTIFAIAKHYPGTTDAKLCWLSNLAADICVKHKTEGSKFLHLL